MSHLPEKISEAKYYVKHKMAILKDEPLIDTSGEIPSDAQEKNMTTTHEINPQHDPNIDQKESETDLISDKSTDGGKPSMTRNSEIP